MCSEHLLTIINDLLDLAKIEAGKMVLECRPFSLERCVKEAFFVNETLPKKLGRSDTLKLSWHISPDVPQQIEGDPTRLRQILVNLIHNAIKFTKKGHVTLRVRNSKEQTSSHLIGSASDLSAQQSIQNEELDEQAQIEFEVEDTGCGISPRKLDSIFEAFTQVKVHRDSGEMDECGPGTGLGLSVCASLVKLMGGQIWAQSTPSKGSTFSFFIKVQRCTSPHSSLNQTDDLCLKLPSDLARQFPLKILCAEDNKINQKVLANMLLHLGYQKEDFKFVRNGKLAVEEMFRPKEGQYDVILMDVHMPEKNGLQASQEILERCRREHIKEPVIVAVTASAFSDDELQCANVGMTHFVSKPIQCSFLASTLREAFHQKSIP